MKRLLIAICDACIGWHQGCRDRHEVAEQRWRQRLRKLRPRTHYAIGGYVRPPDCLCTPASSRQVAEVPGVSICPHGRTWVHPTPDERAQFRAGIRDALKDDPHALALYDEDVSP